MAWWLAGSIIRDLAASLWAQLSRTTDPTVPRPCGTTARCLHLLKYSTHQVRSVAALTLAPSAAMANGLSTCVIGKQTTIPVNSANALARKS